MGKVNDVVERLTGVKPNAIYVTINNDPYVWEWDPIDECPAARAISNREAEIATAIYALEAKREQMRAKAKPIEEAAKTYFGERYELR